VATPPAWKVPASPLTVRPPTGSTGTVQVPKVGSPTLEQWIEEFGMVKKRNVKIFRTAVKGKKEIHVWSVVYRSSPLLFQFAEHWHRLLLENRAAIRAVG
jgi:hypothetical protein